MEIWKGISFSDDPLPHFLLLSWVANLKLCHLSHSSLLTLGDKAPTMFPDGVGKAAANWNTVFSCVVSLSVHLWVYGHLTN